MFRHRAEKQPKTGCLRGKNSNGISTASTEIHRNKESERNEKFQNEFPANCDGFFNSLSVDFRALADLKIPSQAQALSYLARCRIVNDLWIVGMKMVCLCAVRAVVPSSRIKHAKEIAACTSHVRRGLTSRGAQGFGRRARASSQRTGSGLPCRAKAQQGALGHVAGVDIGTMAGQKFHHGNGIELRPCFCQMREVGVRPASSLARPASHHVRAAAHERKLAAARCVMQRGEAVTPSINVETRTAVEQHFDAVQFVGAHIRTACARHHPGRHLLYHTRSSRSATGRWRRRKPPREPAALDVGTGFNQPFHNFDIVGNVTASSQELAAAVVSRRPRLQEKRHGCRDHRLQTAWHRSETSWKLVRGSRALMSSGWRSRWLRLRVAARRATPLRDIRRPGGPSPSARATSRRQPPIARSQRSYDVTPDSFIRT